MVGKFQTKNVYVDTEYDNVILVDPNLVQAEDGSPIPRLVQHEDLVYYANLETKIVPRTKLASGESLDVINTTIASFIGGNSNDNLNFLKPKNKKGTFDTSWSDQITGDQSRVGGGLNQTTEQVSTVTDNNGAKKLIFNRNITNYQDTQTLGIKSISVKVTAAGIPQVDMTLVDVQGRTLFEQGENSLYSIFFNLPYPAFFLTLKGYYGKAVRYQLALISFNAKLDPKSGNFDISLKMIGRPSALLFDTLMGYGKTAPKMFKREYFIGGETSTSNQNGVSKNAEQKITTTLGRQRLEQVYEEYEEKKLIPPGFPRLSIEDFQYRIQGFEKWLEDYKQKQNLQVLGNVYKFRKDLTDLKKEVYDYSISRYLDVNNVFKINNELYYPYKSDINRTQKDEYLTRVRSVIDTYTKDLENNPSFGKNGTYQLSENSDIVSSEIPFKIDVNKLLVKRDLVGAPLTEKEYQDTFFLRTGKVYSQDNDEYLKFKANIASSLVVLTKEIDIATGSIVNVSTDFFVFGTRDKFDQDLVKDGFLDVIVSSQTSLTAKEQTIEKELSEGLAVTLASSDQGVGFRPTIRNVFAVLFAGIDAFYRMMDDTHRLAWDQRTNETRVRAILQDGQGVDSKGYVAGSGQENIVYPWPQYYVLEVDKDGKEQYNIQYPGDPQFVNITKGNVQSVWPEVNFTEQYLTGAATKLDQVDNSVFVNPVLYPYNSEINLIWIDSIVPYSDQVDVNILFEILERAYINANYGKFNRAGIKTYQLDKLFADLEGENIKNAVSNNPLLIETFKNLRLNFNTFKNYLENTFLTKWFNYKNSIYNSFSAERSVFFSDKSKILHLNYLNSYNTQITNDLETKMKEYFKDTQSNEQVFLDTYPLTNVAWLKENMANGNAISSTSSFNETNKVFTIEPKIKKISRLDKNEDGQEINLFTNNKILDNGSNPPLSFNNSSNQAISVSTSETLKQFYENRKNNPNSFYITESTIDYGNEYSGQVKSQVQTTSLLNTPYFVNALLSGVEIEKNSGATPYAALGYLYLNSLPLITTKEKLKTVDNGTQSDLEYLAASFTKFSAIHQVPYAWVLKYGSIWHRYKKWVETGEDILDDNTVWKNFDAANAWDPTGNTKTKSNVYSEFGGIVKSITLQSDIAGLPLSVPSNTQAFNVGYYPKVLNSMYRFFTKKDLYSGYTNDAYASAYDEKGVGVFLSNSFSVAPTIQNAYEQTIVNSYETYIKVKSNDANFTTDFENKIILIPSCGQIPFNQANFECFDDQKNKKIPLLNNESFYNGSVRSLWGCSNFGYFDHNKIKKPQPFEYIKKIKKTEEIQNPFDLLNSDTSDEYSSIEEIFAIFDINLLNEFEKKFLYFIDPESKTEGNILLYEDWQASNQTTASPINIEFKRLYYQLMNLYTVDYDIFNNNEKNKQLQNFSERVKEFLNFDVLIQFRNQGYFDRTVFNEFSESTKFMPPDIKYIYNPYNNVLPPQINFNLSEINYPEEWKTLKKYVGFSTIQNLEYNGSSSFITDFFRVMDVEFNVNNIKRLSQIIKIYVTLRLKDNNMSKNRFKQLLTDYLTKQERFQADMINETFSYLNKNLKNIKRVDDQTQSTVTGNVIKLETYSTLKALNDKWVAGSDLLSKTLFEDFLFLDRTNSDIGDEFTIDITSKKFRALLGTENDNKPIIDIVSTILEDNNFIFMAMPAYVNFYNIQEAVREGEDIPYEIPNSLFGTYLNVDYIKSKPTFLCMYTGEPSKHLDNNTENNRFNNDSFDLRKSSNPIRVPQTKDINKNKSNLVTAFNVDFGIQNQNIFSDLSLDMAEKKNTAESFKIEAEIANSASGDKVAQQSQSLYNIYRARSYTCGVTSMGNAMIQPTMYFNLRHVPLFYGPYFIIEVTHKVDDKRFDTEFKGYRVSKYSFPKPDSYLASINKNLLEKTKVDLIKKANENWLLSTGYTTDPNATVNNTPLLDDLGVCSDNVFADYVNVPFVNSVSTTISDSELKNKLDNQITTNVALRAYLFGIANVSVGNKVDKDQIFSFNNNLFAYQTSSEYKGSIGDYVKQQACIRINNYPTPIISFTDYNICIEMAAALHGPQISTILNPLIALNNEPSKSKDQQIGKAMAQMYIALFETLDGYDSNGNTDATRVRDAINTKLANLDIQQTAFDAYVAIFANSASLFNVTI